MEDLSLQDLEEQKRARERANYHKRKQKRKEEEAATGQKSAVSASRLIRQKIKRLLEGQSFETWKEKDQRKLETTKMRKKRRAGLMKIISQLRAKFEASRRGERGHQKKKTPSKQKAPTNQVEHERQR